MTFSLPPDPGLPGWLQAVLFARDPRPPAPLRAAVLAANRSGLAVAQVARKGNSVAQIGKRASVAPYAPASAYGRFTPR